MAIFNRTGLTIFWDRYAKKRLAQRGDDVGGEKVVLWYDEEGFPTPLRILSIEGDILRGESYWEGEEMKAPLRRCWLVLEKEPEEAFARVAKAAASVESSEEEREKMVEIYYFLMTTKRFIPGGRILNGAGNEAEFSLYNCFVIPSPQDSREGIMNTLNEQTALMSHGGGVGINISTLRPKGALVRKVRGTSSGSVSWGALFSYVTGLTRSAGSRRGALMLILEDWHPDIISFINSKRDLNFMTNANISVGISDEFMEKVQKDEEWELVFPDTMHPSFDILWDGDLEKWKRSGFPVKVYERLPARKLWENIIESAWQSAEPGIWFRSRSNEYSNSRYYNRLVATNPCVSGDTWVETPEGGRKVKELLGKQCYLYLGGEKVSSDARGFFSSGRKLVYKLTTKLGLEIKATIDHLFLVNDGEWVPLGELSSSDREFLLVLSVGQARRAERDPRRELSGYICAYEYFSSSETLLEMRKEGIATRERRYNWEALERKDWSFLRGFLISSLSWIDEKGTLSLKDEELAKTLQRIALSFGVIARREGETLKDVELLEGGEGTSAAFSLWEHLSDHHIYDKVEKIEEVGEEEVFDVSIPGIHAFSANRIVVHNCGEQPLPPYGACNLGSINLAAHIVNGRINIPLLRSTVRSAVRFLDSIIDLGGYLLEENRKQQLQERRVGLGTVGLAEALIREGLRYGSSDALAWVNIVYSIIMEEAYLASSSLAEQKGSFPLFDFDGFATSAFASSLPSHLLRQIKEKGLRNVTLLTQPPTGTTGTMLGTSTGIEPFFAWEWVRFSKAGTFIEKVQLREELNLSDKELPDYFVTASQLTPEEHVDMQAAVQQWMDSAVSKTANMPNSATLEDVGNLYKRMYEKGCKGGTVFRDGSRGGEQVLKARDSAEENEEGIVCNMGVCEVCE